MRNQRARLWAAGLIAAAGLALAWRSFHASLGRSSERALAPSTTGTFAETALSAVQFDTHPTPETLESVVSAAVDRLNEVGAGPEGAALTGGRMRDLCAVFGDRLRVTLDARYEAHVASLRERGIRVPADEEMYRRGWESQASSMRMAPLQVSALEIRAIYLSGRQVVEDATEQGFRVAMFKPDASRLPVPGDATGTKLDVVEVRIPMAKPPVGSPEARPVLVGYQFAWSVERAQWIPWAMCVYVNLDERHMTIGL